MRDFVVAQNTLACLYTIMQKDEQLRLYRFHTILVRSLVAPISRFVDQCPHDAAVRERISTLAFDPGAPRFFPDWYEDRRIEYALSQVLTKPDRIAEFRHAYLHQLTQAQLKLLDQLYVHPAFWTYAHLLMTDEFPLVRMRVEDFSDHDFQVLHELSAPEESRLLPFRLQLVFDNGSFYQTMGFQHAYAHVYSDDLRYFLNGLTPAVIPTNELMVKNPTYTIFSTTDLTTIINQRYEDLLLLDAVSLHNEVSVAEEFVDIIFDEYVVDENFSLDRLPGRWSKYHKKSVQAALFQGPDENMLRWEVPDWIDISHTVWHDIWNFGPHALSLLLYDADRQVIALVTTTEIAWHLTRYLLLQTYTIDEPDKNDPDWIVSPHVLAVSTQIQSFSYPWQHWIDLIPKRSRDRLEDIYALAKSRMVVNEFLDSQDFSLRINLDKRCERLGLNRNFIEQMIQSVEDSTDTEERKASFTVTTIEGDFELRNLPPLDKQVYRLLTEPLSSGRLFSIRARQAFPLFESYTGGVYSDSVDQEHLVEHIEDLFFVFFDDIDTLPFIMMNYLFLLFHYTGRNWTSVRTYGLELLKVLYPYLQEIGEDDSDVFITRFSDFVYTRLRSRALVEVLDRPTANQRFWGTYSIRPSQLFTALVNKN
jgi:hypothetical protein